MTTMTTETSELSPLNFCQAVNKMVSNLLFVDKHKAKGSPLATVALAVEVAEKIIQAKQTKDYFEGMTFEVPACTGEEEFDNPQCCSIIGQKLLYADWERSHGIQVPCPYATCRGTLKND